jgi:hypothetical protein
MIAKEITQYANPGCFEAGLETGRCKGLTSKGYAPNPIDAYLHTAPGFPAFARVAVDQNTRR